MSAIRLHILLSRLKEEQQCSRHPIVRQSISQILKELDELMIIDIKDIYLIDRIAAFIRGHRIFNSRDNYYYLVGLIVLFYQPGKMYGFDEGYIIRNLLRKLAQIMNKGPRTVKVYIEGSCLYWKHNTNGFRDELDTIYKEAKENITSSARRCTNL